MSNLLHVPWVLNILSIGLPVLLIIYLHQGGLMDILSLDNNSARHHFLVVAAQNLPSWLLKVFQLTFCSFDTPPWGHCPLIFVLLFSTSLLSVAIRYSRLILFTPCSSPRISHFHSPHPARMRNQFLGDEGLLATAVSSLRRPLHC